MLKPHPAYGWDLTKNICETYRTDGRIDLAYTYTPYGEVSPAHTYDQPLRWSSECHDTELGLVYYNYRHYNPAMGRWINTDPLGEIRSRNLYIFAENATTQYLDYLGLDCKTIVNRDNCSITFLLSIVLSYDESAPMEDIPLITNLIENTIESEWNGHKKGCCDVIIDVEFSEYRILHKL